MSEPKNPPANDKQEEQPFDRQAYLKEVRTELLRNLGLPEDTRPEQVARLLEIKQAMDKLKES